MIRVKKSKEPVTFDSRCRKRGQVWLKAHPGYNRPHDYWTEFEPQLRKAFNDRCGYCAMMIMKGEMDHFIPVDKLKRTRKDHLAYEWSNFRYADAVLNQRKSTRKVLDPFTVQNHWFEILLPSLQLVLTPNVPSRKRKLAEFTLKSLGLQDGEVVIRYRYNWFQMYRERKITLAGLNEVAPILAAAVERDKEKGIIW